MQNTNPPTLNRFPKESSPDIVKKFPTGGKKKDTLFLLVASLAVVLAGIGTGWLLSGRTSGETSMPTLNESTPGVKKSDNEVGIEDDSAFPDEAEGTLAEGGLDAEGTHHLERPGGTSQNVYLTSTVIDLQSFVGKKVHVWGQTLSGQKAGWLMDVGKIKALD